jgi:predicted helicase
MSLALKPTHTAVKTYYESLHQFGQFHFDNEAQVSDAFAKLLATCGKKLHLTFIPQFPIERVKNRVIVDGALLDTFHLAHGYWEAKDEKDDLDREIKAKLDKGYPRDNIIFQAPERAVLYQAGARIADEDISKPDYLVQIVNQFFDYKAPHIEEWEQAVREFSERLPKLAAAVKKIIDEERLRNPAFVRSFDDFYALCRQTINPNLSQEAVERMLIQHLLTERIFERIFDNPDFTRRNVVAAEIEKVIVELTRRAFNRNEFLRPLDRFYKAIEQSAENTTGFSEKQAFLNTVYERFFQGYSPKEADTHGIVYTPQPIVNFMVRSVEEILQKEFGHSLGDKDVHILDPFVGTGNFIVRIMHEIKATDLPVKYENELHCNEVTLLPYYIASMNIEHAYFDRTGEYRPFPGICLVDTFELAETKQSLFGFVAAENAERVNREKSATIFVIIGNPPYNANQVNENDNNKNREYEAMDERIADTYRKDSNATLTNKLNDPYVKAIRWASDRIGPEGVVAFVTNNSFMGAESFDGVRKHLASDFSAIYLLDLKGDARTAGERRKREAGNVFEDQIRVGVGITFFVRKRDSHGPAKIVKYSVADYLNVRQKQNLLIDFGKYSAVPYRPVTVTPTSAWLVDQKTTGFAELLPLCDKGPGTSADSAIFRDYSLGVSTNRDEVVYGQGSDALLERVSKQAEKFNVEALRFQQSGKELKDFELSSDVKWSETLKRKLASKVRIEIDSSLAKVALYRPYWKRLIYYDSALIDRPGRFRSYYQGKEANLVFCCSAVSDKRAFSCLCTNVLADLHLTGDTQCFPFHTYAEDGTHRRENITDWALEQFRSHYHDPSITKWDIFHYIYAVLHHPEYRERYAANLRRELPRVPFVGSTSAFRALAGAGQRLAEIHVHYEQQPEYPLVKTEKAGQKLDYRMTKMKLSKDKTSLIYNQFLTLSKIPPETYEYRLGNRSALEWVVDQYQVSTDKRSGITNDPNRADDLQYILRLIGQVITVSLETVKIVKSLPRWSME